MAAKGEKIMTRSLLIVGLPRSMSSLIYCLCRDMTKKCLKTLDKNIFHEGDIFNHIQHFYPKILKKFGNPKLNQYQKHKKLLDKHKGGFLIKTVCQPRYLKKYFDENSDAYNVLIIRRDPADVVYSLYLKEWYWVINILGLNSELERNQNIKKLCRAVIKIQEEYNEKIEGKFLISYDNLLEDETLLYRKLIEMGYDPNFISHLDASFKRKRDAVFLTRKTPLYQMIKNELALLKTT
tara:strand:- start:159 stop:869 length:711 start_codon:yes stop_codon:yes gene_type:complete